MACPFFFPVRRLDPGLWAHLPRLPLGDPYAGQCHADPAAPFEPSEQHQRALCNCGYARSECSHFPGGDAADAVRFSMIDDAGERLQLVFILEREHVPLEHHKITVGPAEDEMDLPPRFAAQARAFLESHLRRRSPDSTMGNSVPNLRPRPRRLKVSAGG